MVGVPGLAKTALVNTLSKALGTQIRARTVHAGT